MGPKTSSIEQQKQDQFFSNFEIIQQIQSENIRFLEHKTTKKQYLLRQLSFNDKKQYFKAIQTVKTKKQQLKGATHVNNLQDYFDKQEDQYCSTFYKIYVLFEYPQRTLDDQINQRNVDKKSFVETELWSILASSILGLSHLQRKGIKHSSLKTSMIFLSPEGHIKVSDPFTTDCVSNYQCLLNKRNTRHIYLSPEQCQSLQNEAISLQSNPFKSDIFTLGMIMLQCGLLQYQDECYRDQNSRIHWETLQYNKNRFRRAYSDQLANMLDYMLGVDPADRPEWTELQAYVITDSMGQSFMSQGRKSLIAANSKPGSVNKPPPFQQSTVNPHRNQDSSSMLYHPQRPHSQLYNGNSQVDHQPLPFSAANNFYPNHNSGNNQNDNQNSRNTNSQSRAQGSVSSSSLPPQGRPYSHSQFNPNPQSVSSLPPFSSGNYNTPTQNAQSSASTSTAYVKNFDIQPVAVSNISNSRPLKSVFPSAVWEWRTKTDENLVQVMTQEISQNSSRSRSMISRSQNQMKLMPSSSDNKKNFKNEKDRDTSNYQHHRYESQPYIDASVNSKTNPLNPNHNTNPNVHFNHGNSNNYAGTTSAPYSSSNYYHGQGQSHGQPVSSYPSYTPVKTLKQTNVNVNTTLPQYTAQTTQFNGNNNNNATSQSSTSALNSASEFVVQTFRLGSKYQGYKRNGLRNGQGRFYYQDGGMYDGNWVNNKMEGFGKLYYQSGKIAYEGDWIADQFTGKGILHNEKPDIIEGGFDYTNFDEIEQLWTKYQGEFIDDFKHGQGILYLSNGEFFEGEFQNDVVQGQGVYTDYNGRKIKGVWEANVLVKEIS